jgi:hypothetical protein
MNSILPQLLELAKYTVPALVVLAATYLLVKRFLTTDLQQKQLSLLQDTQNITIPLRLQAYERLAIFLERISFRNLINRVYENGMTVADLRYALTFNITSEFEYNISQQIYVSRQVWQTVVHAREQEISMVHTLAQQLPAEAPGRELQVKLMDYLMSSEEGLPGEIALQMINEEARKVLSYGTQAGT